MIRKGGVPKKVRRAAIALSEAARSVSARVKLATPSRVVRKLGSLRKKRAKKARYRVPVAFVHGGVETFEQRPPDEDEYDEWGVWRFPQVLHEDVFELLPFDSRVKGTCVEAPELVEYRRVSRELFSQRKFRRSGIAPMPQDLRELLVGTPIERFAVFPPQGPDGWPVNLVCASGFEKPVAGETLLREDFLDASLPRATISDFEIPGVIRQVELIKSVRFRTVR
jgi:hypothetical protein